MSSLVRLLNRLLPFATPGTPVYQDVVHFGVLALLLYYAPQIQEVLQRHARNEQANDQPQNEAVQPGTNEAVNEPQADAIGPEDNHVHDNGAVEAEQGDHMPPLRHEAADEPVAAGPVEGARNPPQQRNVGAKKAKSLAKRDQRRQWHEFQRSQGEAQRAKDAEGAAEREAAHAAEVARRKATEAKLEAQKARERERRREQERKEREEQIATRERAVKFVRHELEGKRMCNLFDVAGQVGGDYDEVSLEKILNAARLLGRAADGAVTMVTSTGWLVRVRSEDMAQAYATAAATYEGEIGFEQFGQVLWAILQNSTS